MNAKQRRKKYRELARENGLNYMIFRIAGEATAVVQHIVGMDITFSNGDYPLLFAWKGESCENGRLSCDRISEAEATTLVEFGIPLYRNPRGIIRISG